MTEIFKVRALGQNVPNHIPILSGITFGLLNKRLVFEVSMVDVENPLFINIVAKFEEDKEEIQFEAHSIENNELDIFFYNPCKSGDSGLSFPIGLLRTGQNVLGFMFRLDMIKGAEAYRISYEFYQGRLSADEERQG